MVLLIDADILLYRVAWACQNRNGNTYTFKDCIDTLNNYMSTMVNNLGSNKYIAYLTGINNFREKITASKPYKGNRISEKPTFYYLLREYMVQNLHCHIINGMEADDALAISYNLIPDSIICSTDKDLLQIAGRHYNIVKQQSIVITEAEAEYNLWSQVLTGDPTDNIAGIYNVGPKTASNILSGSSDYAHTVLDKYIETYGFKQGIACFNSTFQLIYILREYDFKLPATSIYEGNPLQRMEDPLQPNTEWIQPFG